MAKRVAPKVRLLDTTCKLIDKERKIYCPVGVPDALAKVLLKLYDETLKLGKCNKTQLRFEFGNQATGNKSYCEYKTHRYDVYSGFIGIETIKRHTKDEGWWYLENAYQRQHNKSVPEHLYGLSFIGFAKYQSSVEMYQLKNIVRISHWDKRYGDTIWQHRGYKEKNYSHFKIRAVRTVTIEEDILVVAADGPQARKMVKGRLKRPTKDEVAKAKFKTSCKILGVAKK